jgi:hypothetical protein
VLAQRSTLKHQMNGIHPHPFKGTDYLATIETQAQTLGNHVQVYNRKP